MIAALFVQADGCYYGLPDVDPWDKARDAKCYEGPHRVVAHPPCERWGRFARGAPNKPNQYEIGDDGGCFEAALNAVVRWGGVIEHPAQSHAWAFFNLPAPGHRGGWTNTFPLASCHVEQGHYDHFSRKPTWLLACRCNLPDLIWGPSPQRLPAYAIERYGYEKARRIGVMAAVGGKDKTKIRSATPIRFRDLLLSIVRIQNGT